MEINKPDKDQELIERFFHMELNSSELGEFEYRLQNEEGFRGKVDAYEAMDRYVDKQLHPATLISKQAKVQEWKEKWSDKKNEDKVIKRSISPWVWGIAASLAILVTLVWVFQDMISPPNYPALAESYWTDSNSGNAIFSNLYTKSDTKSTKALEQLKQAHQAYLKKDYASALSLIKPIQDTSVYFTKAKLLEGIVFFEQEQYLEAKQTFEDLANNRPTENQDVTLWFLALSNLGMEDLNATKAQLNSIIQAAYPQRNQAKDLLRKLE